MKKYFSTFMTALYGKKKKGFTLFIALIVSSILLAVGFSIGNIILKQIQLSTAGRESQLAFYAADSAAECALYWDRKNTAGESVIDEAFGTTTTLSYVQDTVQIKCGSGVDGAGSVNVISKNVNESTNSATTTFYVDYQDLTGYGYASCSKVTVGRNGNNTSIDARGYNAAYDAGLGACNTANPRTVERGLLLLY